MKNLKVSQEEKNRILEQHFPKKLNEDLEDAPFEKGPSGMRAARSRADYEPAGAREVELGTGVFGKYSEEIPPIVIRYMRKNPRLIIQRLKSIYGDKIFDYLENE